MTVGLLSFGAPSFPINNALVQGAPQPSGGDFPFVNHFKNGQGWSGASWVDPNTLDSDGWPDTLPQSLENAFYLPTQADRPGDYIVDWQGNGTISLGGGHATLASPYTNADRTSTTGAGLFKFSMPSGTNYVTVGISAITTKITDIRVYHEDDAGIIDTEIFSPLLIQYARNFGVIRFMDVHYCGRASGMGNLTTWATRKPSTYAIWGGPERRSSITYGTASYALNGSSNDYSKTYTDANGSSSAGPFDKETIILKVGNTATNTTCTFNKNGTGALPIIRNDATAMTSGSKPDSGKYMTLIYDEAFNSWLQWGGNTNDGSFYLLNGWPIEVFMELCKKAGAHPLVTFCHTMFDPITDYPAQCATYIKANFQDTDCPWMVPRYEPANELWNGAFTQTVYARAKSRLRNGSSSATSPVLPVTAFSYTGTGATGVSTITATGASIYSVGSALFLSATGWTGLTGWAGNTVYVTEINVGSDPDTFKVNRAPTSGTWTAGSPTVLGQENDSNNWYGIAMSELGQAIAGVYGVVKADVKTQPYYETIACVQTEGTTSSADERLNSSQYVILGGDPAKEWTTMLGIAQYAAPALRGRPEELGMAWLYNQGDLTQGDDYCDTLTGHASYPSAQATLPDLSSTYGDWKTWAQGKTVDRMCGYEGGYSPDYKAVGTTVTCTITGATKAANCVLTVSNGAIETGWVAAALNANGCFDANCAGLTFTISGVSGMTELNGLTATIVSVSGNQVTTNIDSSAFTTYTSGGTATVVNGRDLINALRYAGKKSTNLKAHTKTNLQNFVDKTDGTFTAVFPSGFIWTGSSTPTNLGTTQTIGNGQIWSVRDPTIYADTDPQSLAIEEFNAGI